MEIKIALAGNPNCGKTTLFNALTGANQFVGNWPGVTVEKKEGRLKGEKDVIITDLPGIYSLSPYTMEEVVARNVLIDKRLSVPCRWRAAARRPSRSIASPAASSMRWLTSRKSCFTTCRKSSSAGSPSRSLSATSS